MECIVSDNLYITATEARSGKSLVSLGVMEMLLRKIEKVGFFRPIARGRPGVDEVDNDLHLISQHFKLAIPYEMMFGVTTWEAGEWLTRNKEGEVIETILSKYHTLSGACDFVLCEGTDFASSSAAFEFDINEEISKNLGCPVLLVANGYRKPVEAVLQSVELALDSLTAKGVQAIATIVNRVQEEDRAKIVDRLALRGGPLGQLAFALPDEPALGKPTVGEIARILNAEVLFGKDKLNRHVHNFAVAAMQLQNLLPRIEHGSLIITPGDRVDVIVGCLAAASSTSVEAIAGILLTGGLKPEGDVWNLIRGFPQVVPILSVRENTFPTAAVVDRIHATLSPEDDRKMTLALSIFEKNVDVARLSEKVITTRTTIVTPKMFEFNLIQKARAQRKHIVFPEGEEERILQAAETLLRREVVEITLLGDADLIRQKISQLGLILNGAKIVTPSKSPFIDDYARTYFALREHKGITPENAFDLMADANFFGTMMIHKGHADGMVSGAAHSTAATIRPAFEIIKCKPGFSIVSSVFFMCLADRVLVYGDCAVNPNPTAEQLAEIALTSAHTALRFGIQPAVAMLSYSTGESGKGEDVEKVRLATHLAREKAKTAFPSLEIDGPMQYDAAVDAAVAGTKMPASVVAGRATVLIFPDLNTGNNTYKAVQRSAGAVAIGPILQGLKHPVNDLSRGCTVTDIVNTVAITAIQAQSEKGHL
jgi:phosphate acetyltransferase